MWKVLVMLALAMQIVPAMPGQQAGATGQSANSASKKTNDEKDESSVSIAVKPADKTTNPKQIGQPVAAENKEQSIKLTGMPPIVIADKNKTWKDLIFDWGPWAFALCLLIVGITQTCAMIWQARLLRGTLGKIEYQARLMERQTAVMEGQAKAVQDSAAAAVLSAAASKSSADSLLDVERARLLVHLLPEPGGVLLAKYFIRNYGRTPAWMTEIKCLYKRLAGGIIGPIDYSAIHSMSSENGWIIPPDKDSVLWSQSLAPNGLLSELECEMIGSGTLLLVFFGTVKYSDIFGREHETRFCYNFIPEFGWVLHGPKECNLRT
jgi:hypothetical protein